MKKLGIILAFALCLIALSAGAAPQRQYGGSGPTPGVITYQGRVAVGGASFTGTGYFRFALVSEAGTAAYWSNDGTGLTTAPFTPTQAVTLTVTDGIFHVGLGDTSLAGMTQPITASHVVTADRYLRVWFDDGVHGVQRLTPDVGLGAVPFALSISDPDITLNTLQLDLTPSITMPSEGLVFWNVDDGTMNIGMPGGNVNLQVGQEIIRRVYNNSGADMYNGQLVYISGSTGARLEVSLAEADNLTWQPRTLYMLTEDIDDNNFGYATFWGDVRDVNTSGMAAGSVLYLSNTAGAYTTTPPSAPSYIYKIGGVLREGTNNGIVTMSQYIGGQLNDNADVSIITPTEGSGLRYDAVNGYWENHPNAVWGNGASTRVAYWSDSDTLTSTSGFNYIGATGVLTVGTNIVLDAGSTTSRISHYSTSSGNTNLDIDPQPSDGSSQAAVRILRNTNTSGIRALGVYRGDGTNTPIHTLQSNSTGSVWFNRENDDIDLRVDGDTLDNLILVDAATDNVQIDLPYGSFSSSADQTVASTTAAYAVAFNTDDIKNKITHSTVTNNSRVYIDKIGTYLITVSAIADCAVANKKMELWLAVDGSNVANTNTVVGLGTGGMETTLAVTFVYRFTSASQYFELMYRSDDTGCYFNATAAGTSPTRPASPSVICTVNKISS